MNVMRNTSTFIIAKHCSKTQSAFAEIIHTNDTMYIEQCMHPVVVDPHCTVSTCQIHNCGCVVFTSVESFLVLELCRFHDTFRI